jgi:hypothetical protein
MGIGVRSAMGLLSSFWREARIQALFRRGREASMKRTSVVAIFALFACSGALAQNPQRNPAPPFESLFSGIVQEQDVALAFRYFRESLDAALEGREPPPPDALIQRGEVIGEDLKRRGGAAARSILDAIEAIVRERVREPSRALPPPSSPVQRLGTRT